MCETIDKIKELTGKLTNAPDFKTFEIFRGSGYKEYGVLNGTMKSQSIHNADEVAIAKTKITKGSILETHKHPNSVELIFMLKGKMKIVVNGSIYFLKEHEHLKIDKGVNHFAHATEDACFMAITIPKDDGFPE